MVDRPKNIGEYYEQLRPPIVRSQGLTESERYLAGLADRTFLNLWSYPNPFRSQKQSGKGDGKEICDLLVVCDPHILIFSEKEISWSDKPIEIAWSRWCRKAVYEAQVQLKGAERWLNEFPDRIFLDKICEIPLPLALPAKDRRRVHRIVVARGAKEACIRHFGGGIGTLVVSPDIKGTDHFTPDANTFMPFAIGDIDPSGDFVHVFDEVALDIVMHELDTVSDFTEYLDKRAAFIRSGRLERARGEEDLLAYYSIRTNENGDHDFTAPQGHTWQEIGSVLIGSNNWADYISNPQYLAKKEADKVSYAWDSLIETFTNHLLGGTTIVLEGHSYSLTNSEIAVRHMALQNRFMRRAHSEAVLNALDRGRDNQVFFRAMVAPPISVRGETGFFILTMKYLQWMEEHGGYEEYRQRRAIHCEIYALAVLMQNPQMEQVIGIAMEPPGQGRGSSEDIIYAAQAEWSEQERSENAEHCALLGIMKNIQHKRYRGQEYPDIVQASRKEYRGNRKQRRAQAADDRNRK